MWRWRSYTFIAALTILATQCDSKNSNSSFPVEGRVTMPDGYSPRHAQVVVTLDGGEQRRGFPRGDGSFTVNDVPPGRHTLQVVAVQCCIFHQVRLDVDKEGGVLAAYAEAPVHKLPVPLLLEPAVKAEYFDKVVPFNIGAFVKSPIGLMAIGMLFIIVVMPYLKVDPAEYQEMLRERAADSTAVEAPVAAGAAKQVVGAPAACGGPQQRGPASRRRG